MSRFPRLRQRPDQWSDAHQHAATLLAERMDGPVGLTGSTWLDEHLASCPSCAAIAAGYEDDRLALRALRDDPPPPPRDLWARTATGIEAAGSGRHSAGGTVRRSLPLGAMSGLVVVVLVVGVSLLSGNVVFQTARPDTAATPDVLGGAGPESSPAFPGGFVEPTPIAIGGADDVEWIESGPDGATTHRVAVDEVCPAKGEADCPDLSEADERQFALKGAPRALVGSPTRQQVVAISETASAGDEVVVVALPDVSETPEPPAEPSPSTTPAPSEAPTVAASSEPSAPVESAPVASASSQPPIATIDPATSPEPTVAATLAIASDIDVVGESAAFSPDGTWFAFTARATDGSGADVYTWHVGDELARPLTDDGASYFASWSGNELIASRPDDPASDEPEPESVRIDPASGTETDAGAGWRPAVDPTGKLAIVWDGTLARTAADGTWTPETGVLELRSWSDSGPGRASGPERDRVVTDTAPRDFDVRWDETGEWVAVWIADPDDLVIGRLTLYHVDPEGERLELVDGAPADVPALPGFSIGNGRLAWATPRGQGGEGSRIQIAAWSSTDVGIVESSPGEDPVVIR